MFCFDPNVGLRLTREGVMSFEAEACFAGSRSGRLACSIECISGFAALDLSGGVLLRVRAASVRIAKRSFVASSRGLSLFTNLIPLLRAVGCAGGVSLLTACTAGGAPGTAQTLGTTPFPVADTPDNTTTIARPPRDGNIAVQEEYDAAIAKNSVEALELFIARHPDHPLAGEAKRLLAQRKSDAGK
jgi:hypothetical protein